jgi:hypothetical protein
MRFICLVSSKGGLPPILPRALAAITGPVEEWTENGVLLAAPDIAQNIFFLPIFRENFML